MKWLPTYIASFILILTYSKEVFGGDFKKGMDAYRKGHNSIALREWAPLARQGHANAQYNLGVMYEKGRGVTQDYKKAVKCYRAAAMKITRRTLRGHPDAQFNLYLCYRDGLGVEKDLEKANYWHNKATERDNVAAFKYFEDQKNVFNFHYWKIQ